MKKQMYIIISLLCAVSLHGADQNIVELSKMVAPVAKTVCLFFGKVEGIDAIVSKLKKRNCTLDVLMRLPVVKEQMPKTGLMGDVYAFKSREKNKPTLLHCGTCGNSRRIVNLSLVGFHWCSRYIPLVHEINEEALTTNTERYAREEDKIIKELDSYGHDVIHEKSETHYYNFLRLLIDTRRLQTFHEITSQFSTDTLRSNARLCDTFFAAQSEITKSNWQDGKDLIKKIESIFIKESTKKSTPICTHMARAALGMASMTGLLGLIWLGDDYSRQENVPGACYFWYNQTIE